MDVAQLVKSTQEQGFAAWVDYLNQLRLNELLAKLTAQDINLEKTLAELQKMKTNIAALIASNRGGEKGLHGYIAEAAEVGVENARNLIKGLDAVCEWVNDNGPVDLIRDGTEIQQKFVKAFFSLSQNNGVLAHQADYPWFVKQGGKYQIPKDFYDALMKLWNMPQEEAGKLVRSNSSDDKNFFTYANWKEIQKFFKNSGITPDDIEPSLLNYDDVKKGTIYQTIEKEEASLRKTDKQIRDTAYEASKPTLRQGTQAAAVGAAAEGGMAFCLGIMKKRKQGKRLAEFTAEDWQEVGIDTAKGTVQGGVRGGAIYAMTNFTATPAAVANALVTASFGIVAQAYQLQQGNISAEDFIVNSEVLCLDVSVSAVASLLGQTLIPVPVLGAIIGNVAGMFMYQIAKDHLSAKEQALIANYRESFASLNKMLEERYQQLMVQLKKEFAKYTSMLELAFDRDVNIAFDGSIALADYVGVAQDRVLRNKTDIDNYFLN